MGGKGQRRVCKHAGNNNRVRGISAAVAHYGLKEFFGSF